MGASPSRASYSWRIARICVRVSAGACRTRPENTSCGGAAVHDPVKDFQHTKLSMCMQRGRRRVTAATSATPRPRSGAAVWSLRDQTRPLPTDAQAMTPVVDLWGNSRGGRYTVLSRVPAHSGGCTPSSYVHTQVAARQTEVSAPVWRSMPLSMV